MSNFQFDGTNYSSAPAAGFAHAAHQRAVADVRRRAGRQLAHDQAASARAAAKREARLLDIARRPRGVTTVIGRRPDGRPVHRAIPAFTPRPYTPPEKRVERPAPAIVSVNGWLYNVRPAEERIASALKAEAPDEGPHYVRAVMAEGFGLDDSAAHHDRMADKRDDQRAARKVRMAAKRRRGWS